MNNQKTINKKLTYKSLLLEKEYIKNLIAKVISRFGDSLDSIAYSWMVYQLTGSKVLMASLFAVNGIPNIIFGMIAGVFAGHHSKKKIIFFCDIGRGLIVFLTALLFMLNLLKPWHLYIFTFINSTFESFRSPSSMSLYSMILKDEKFNHGMSLDNILTRIGELLGFSIAAILIGFIGIPGTIIIDSITFFICGFIIITIKYEDLINKKTITLKSGFVELKEGFNYLLKSKLVFYICILAASINFLVLPFDSMQAPYVKEVLCRGPEALSIMAVPLLIGMICSGLIFPKIAKILSSFYIFILGGFLLGMSYLGLSLLGRISDSNFILIILVLLCFLMGTSITFISTPMQVAFMTKVEKEFLPRVVSIFNALALFATPLGGFIFSALFKFFNLSQLFMGISIAIMILSILLFFSKELRKI